MIACYFSHLKGRARVEDIGVIQAGDALVMETKMRDASKEVVVALIPPVNIVTVVV